jgi:hypothetical protein
MIRMLRQVPDVSLPEPLTTSGFPEATDRRWAGRNNRLPFGADARTMFVMFLHARLTTPTLPVGAFERACDGLER